MYLRYIFFAVFCVATFAEPDITREESVLVLNKDNFDHVIENNQFVLVEFYAPWCGHCKALAPEYAKAATQLAEDSSPILLAKVDATIETDLAEKYEVRGYPTMKFFRDKHVLEYNGGRTSEEILKWVKKKSGPPAVTLNTLEEFNQFKDSANLVLVGLFKDLESKEAKVFLDLAVANDEDPFAIASADDVFKAAGVEKDSVVLLKNFDEGRNVHDGEINTETLKKFISSNRLPLVVDFTESTSRRIFAGDIKFFSLLFISKKSAEAEKLLETFRAVAKGYKGTVYFVTIDLDVEENERILDFFGIKAADAPIMNVIKLEEDLVKFRPEKNDLSEDAIREFVQKVLDGKAKKFLLTQDVPENWDAEPVKVLVGKNFDSVAFDKSKNVLVEFYAPWCVHCEKLKPIYDELGAKYKDDDSIVIAKMDATANELENISINSYPTIKLFKKDSNEVIEYNGERTLDGLIKFLDTDGEYGRAAPEEIINFTGDRTLEGLSKFVDSDGEIGGTTKEEPEKANVDAEEEEQVEKQGQKDEL